MSKESLKEQTKKVKGGLFLPFDINKHTSALKKSTADSTKPFIDIADAYVANTNATISTLSLPFNLIASSVYSRRFQALHTAEMIRNLKTDDSMRVKTKKAAAKRARKAMENSKEVDHLRDATVHEALMVLNDVDMSVAVAELLKQGVVLTWTSFEVFVRDFFKTSISHNNDLAIQLSESKETKKIFNTRNIPLTVLAENDFNIKNILGDLMLSNNSLSSILTIKKVFKVMFPKKRVLHEALNSKKLWELAQRRHLIVHHKGLINQSYLSKTGDKRPVGSQLTIKPDDIKSYINSSFKVIEQLLQASSHQ